MNHRIRIAPLGLVITACGPRAYRAPRFAYGEPLHDVSDVRPEASKATLVFLRPYRYDSKTASALWDEQLHFLGAIRHGDVLVTQVEPGRHTIMAIGERGDFIEVNAAAGRSYFIKVFARPGWRRARFSMSAVDRNRDEWKLVPEWLATCGPVSLDATMLAWAERERPRAEALWQADFPRWSEKADRPIIAAELGLTSSR